MKINRKSLGYRLVVPTVCSIAVITAVLLCIVTFITGRILDDYRKYIATSHADDIRRLLDSAQAELTTATLLNNPAVVEAKKRTLVESVFLNWQREGIGGIIADQNGRILRSSLPAELTARIFAFPRTGYFQFKGEHGLLYGQMVMFHSWGWWIIPIVEDMGSISSRGVQYLLPLVAFGSLLMLGVLVFFFRHNLQKPVTIMVDSVRKEQPVPSVGIDEFDMIGQAINDAMQHIREQTSDLAEELARRKQAEEDLREEKNKLEAIIAAIGDGISIQDRDFAVLYQNDVHKGFVGDHAGEFCYIAYENKQEVCRECPVVLAFNDGKIHTAERAVKQKDHIKHFEITASPLRDSSGAIVAGVELVKDITERKRAEEQLRQAQKMEGIGQLAGGVAHDFNNVLNVVQGYAELLQMTLSETNPSLKDYANEILAASRRGAEITRQILAFSRKETITITPVDLNELITALQKMLRRLLREDISIQFYLSQTPLVALVDAGQIDQILINLATNARDAMPSGGTLKIASEQISFDQEFIESHGFGTSGNFALLTVSDTGVGMDESVRTRVFDPFFTTKEVGKGTGLGLAMVYGIVKKHKGYINIYSEPGMGTVFKIYLPLAVDTTLHLDADGAEDLATIRGGTETILVAEDNNALRALTKSILEGAGYRVIEASDGEEAVQTHLMGNTHIHLALLDGIMPRKNGKQSLMEMRIRQPNLKAIIVSGYAEDVFSFQDLASLNVVFIPKPFNRQHLLKKVREVLDS